MTFVAIAKSNQGIIASSRGATLFAIPFILLGVSLLQDNTFSPQCITPFMCVLGALSVDMRDAKTGISQEKTLMKNEAMCA